LAAGPGAADYGLLGIIAQTAYSVRLVKDVSPTCFLPPPEVRSAIVEMIRLAEDREVRPENRAALLRLLQGAFSRRRKQLAPFLKAHAGLSDADQARLFDLLGIEPRARPEDLSPEQWIRLANDIGAFPLDPRR
ncbi:MAG: 16S rRNA (adenine(1518)-N(6)/adenine(1519)-N(6))-dimethyltransferase, partial [Verrucomicrobia bacterium]|nr:16S rRNA (adenine(1518)-N(6)/adenine(1519)-N(6))-dimethyltransferase [Verrucomicrobiota bacterium]